MSIAKESLRDLGSAHQRLAELQQRALRKDSQLAEILPDFLQELQTTLDELQVAEEDLSLQNEQLVASNEAAARDRQRYQDLFDLAPDGCVVTDRVGVIQEANRAAGSMLGVAPDLLAGKPLVVFVAQGDRQAYQELLSRLRTEKEIRKPEMRLRPREGLPQPVSVFAAPIRNERGRFAGIQWMLHDISDLKEAQERTLQAQRLGTIGQTMAALAHECRNALQRSQSCLSMLALEVRDRPAALGLIDRMQKAQNDLRHLFEDIRDYSAPIRLDLQSCDLPAVWRNAWADLEASHRERNVTPREQVHDVELRCVADGSRLVQVFRNVFDNALAACQDPVEIVIDCARGQLDGRPAIRVAVRDNGPGLSPEQKQHMFDAFYTTKTRGMGLGMAIAYRIVQAHGGTIDAGDGTGRGAEILITLPKGKP
jgi:PAS domain S-box-containing protein